MYNLPLLRPNLKLADKHKYLLAKNNISLNSSMITLH